MFFMIFARDRPGMLDRRLAHRPAHVSYWSGQGEALKVAGAMLSSDGPDAEPIGSSFLIEAENEAAARELIAGDPFTKQSIFGDEITVQPVRPALGVWRRD
jgi:uncharacterized protein YciI